MLYAVLALLAATEGATRKVVAAVHAVLSETVARFATQQRGVPFLCLAPHGGCLQSTANSERPPTPFSTTASGSLLQALTESSCRSQRQQPCGRRPAGSKQ